MINWTMLSLILYIYVSDVDHIDVWLYKLRSDTLVQNDLGLVYTNEEEDEREAGVEI